MLREAWNGFTRPERKRCVWFVTTLRPEWKVVPTVAFSHFSPRLPCRLVVWMPGNAGESAYPKTNVKLMGRRGKVGRCEPWHYVRANDPAHGDSSVFCFPLCKWRFFFSSRRWFSLRPVDLKKSPQPENEMRRVVIYLWKWKKKKVRVCSSTKCSGAPSEKCKEFHRGSDIGNVLFFYFFIASCATAG